MLGHVITRKRNVPRCVLEVSILAISVVIYCQAPDNFPLLPHISYTEIINHICVYDSIKNFEIPEWNPYLGGGFPLSPSSKYLFFYGVNRLTFSIIMLALAVLCLIIEGAKKLSSLLIILLYMTSLVTYSPVPMAVCLLSIGIINNSRIARLLSTMITPGLSLMYEVSIKNPSSLVIISAIVGILDVILSNSFSPHFLPIVDNPPTMIEILIDLIEYATMFVPSVIIIYALSKLTTSVNAKRAIIVYSILFAIMFLQFTYTSISLASLPILLILVFKVLRKVRFGDKLKVIYNLSVIITGVLFAGTISALSTPHAILSHIVKLGSGVPIVITSNPFMDTVVSLDHKKSVANPPSIAFTPLSRSTAAFLKSIRAISSPLLGIYPSASAIEKFEFYIPIYILPKIYALKSITLLQTCKIISKVKTNKKTVNTPVILTPRDIICNGITFQQYSTWWNHGRFYDYMIAYHGKIHYSRPSAVITAILQPILLLGTVLRTVL